MSKRARLFLILIVIIGSGVFLLPTFEWYFVISQDMKDIAAGSREQIRLYAQSEAADGLDELVALANREEDVELPEEYSFLAAIAKDNYKLEKKPVPKTWTVRAVLASLGGQEKAFGALEEEYRESILALKERDNDILKLGLDLSGGMSILLRADLDSLAERLERNPTSEDREAAIDRAMEILNNRIDKFGLTEPQIRRQGTEQIYIEIPGAADPEVVDSFLKGKGTLNFHIEDEEATSRFLDYAAANPGNFLGRDGQPRDPDVLDAGLIVRGLYRKDQYGIDQLVRYLVLKEEVGLDGTHIQGATVGTHPVTGRPVINFTLDREGGELFFQLTSANVEKPLAIVLDDKVKAGARISEPIRDSVQITGFDRQEASDLALVLRTAALPVDLIVENQQAIGASLGEDSIRQGLNAISLGGALVILFMLAYYRRAGVIADLALVLNLFIIIGILSAFRFTLSLTSIAGIILTVGMAVDANVIIFERIKEEYRIGKSPDAAVKAGFRKAFWTIMDANITTFIAAIFLSQMTTGPIKGFAYTLAVGIVTSMFTALFVSRLIFDFSTETLNVKKLHIGWRTK